MLLDDLAGDLLDQFFIVGHKPKKKSQMSRSGPPWSDHPPASLSGTKGLPIEERKVILIIGLEGLAYEEIAAVLNGPVGTMRSRLSRGREQLRRRGYGGKWADRAMGG